MTIASSEADTHKEYKQGDAQRLLTTASADRMIHDTWNYEYDATKSGFEEADNKTLPESPQEDPILGFFAPYLTIPNVYNAANFLKGMAQCGYGYYATDANDAKTACNANFMHNALLFGTFVAQAFPTTGPAGTELDSGKLKALQKELTTCNKAKRNYRGAAQITFREKDVLNSTLNECLAEKDGVVDHLIRCDDALAKATQQCVQRCNEDNKVLKKLLANEAADNEDLRKDNDRLRNLERLAALIPYAEGWLALAVQIMLVCIVIVWLALAKGLQALGGAAWNGLSVRLFLFVTICPCWILFVYNNPTKLFSEDKAVREAFWSECVTSMLRNFSAVFVLCIWTACTCVFLQVIVLPIVAAVRDRLSVPVNSRGVRPNNQHNELQLNYGPVIREYRQLAQLRQQQQEQQVPRMSTLVPRQRQEEQNFFAQRIVRMNNPPRMEQLDD
jgi:hypothetical protein